MQKILISDVGAIMGLSPHTTREAVMRKMVRATKAAPSEDVVNPAVLWQIANRKGATMDYVLETGAVIRETYSELAMFHVGNYTTVGNDGVLEVRCPYDQRDKEVPQFKRLSAMAHHMAKCHVLMHAAGANWCDFWQWAPRGGQVQRLDFDMDFMTSILSDCSQFYDEYLGTIEDDERCKVHLEEEVPVVNTQEARKLMDEYLELSEMEDRAKDRKKEILTVMVVAAGERPCMFGGRKLIKVEKDGAISYAKAIKELAPNADLSKWRGSPTSYWMVK